MAGYTGSIPITGFIAPTDNQDTYPVIDPLFGIDGLRNVQTEADMYAIPAGRRRVGMVVGCVGSGNYYKLLSAPWSYNSSDWANFLSIAAPGNIPRTQYYIAGGSVSVPQYYQYLVYGNMTIGASGSLINDGQVIIINGTLSFSGNGTYSGAGTLTYLTDFTRTNISTGPNPNFGMSQPNVKYSASFSSSASVPITITHSLNTTDITYSVRENNNFITVNLTINDANTVILTTDANITYGRINIIG